MSQFMWPVDAAFRSSRKNEAFVFKGNKYVLINYAPGTTDDEVVHGPLLIRDGFPSLAGTVFEKGIDAAFESSRKYEAYIFRGNRYARINYCSNPHLVSISLIAQCFPSLRNTIFESGIHAAFASHRYNEAYIFKYGDYTRINFAPGTTSDYIIGGVKEIYQNWPSLSVIVPRRPAPKFGVGLVVVVEDTSS
ncbi:albumin-2-like [Punica granatum]|uniref:Albumin-2-like n=1 Tax=Punica granatum TaxID=22663 RepID=A0A6P8D6X6_PUNGR|nr:albumin-2-like [Punica granatum]